MRDTAVFESVQRELNRQRNNVELIATITHYCIKGLEVPFIYGRLGRGVTELNTRPMVAKFVYGALGKQR